MSTILNPTRPKGGTESIEISRISEPGFKRASDQTEDEPFPQIK